jgi:type IX secretion system PorP/SprF family membrane protein
MKKQLFTLLTVLISFVGYAQQDAQFTQYMYNTININPAYAGSRGALSVFGLHRNQWVGLNGAPVTNTLSLNTPVNNSNIGIGISFINDEIGPSEENTISADVSYTIKASSTYKLSFGVKATANLLNIDLNKPTRYNADDLRNVNSIDNEFSPNVGAGVYLHSEKTYFGVSIPNFLETKHFDGTPVGSNSYLASERMHLFAIAGHVFDLSESIKFKPAVLTKAVKGAPLQLDVSGNFMFNDKFVLGAAWRWDAAASLMAGFQVNKSWFIGYGYDLETTELRQYNSGSHEIFLRYELFKNTDRIVSPRFF